MLQSFNGEWISNFNLAFLAFYLFLYKDTSGELQRLQYSPLHAFPTQVSCPRREQILHPLQGARIFCPPLKSFICSL